MGLDYTVLSSLMILGSFKFEPLKRRADQTMESRTLIPLSRTYGARALNYTLEDADSQWMQCRFVVARSEDRCFVGSWIFARSPLNVSSGCTALVSVLTLPI
jgi:hypothetical protein